MLDKLFEKTGYITLKKLNCKIDCSAFYPGITQYYDFNKNGIPFIRVNEIQNGFVKITDNTAFLPRFVLNANSSTIAKAYPNDIVIAKGGNTLAKIGILTNEYSEYAICRDVLLVRTNNLTFNQKYSIWAYLHSKFGYQQMLKTASQTGQPHLTVPNIAELKMPKWIETDNRFSENYLKAQELLLMAGKQYTEAEDILLSELGIKNWHPKNENISVKNFSNYLETGRLDAEYYQSKYDELFEHLSKFNCDNLGNIVNIKKSIEPGSESYLNEGIPFIRVADINKYEIDKTDIYLSPKEFKLEQLKPRKNTILLSKDGSIGIAYKCKSDMDIITSGALLHLTIKDKDVLPDYLTLVLNSIVVQLQAERNSNGAIIQHWKPEEIKKVIIPKLSNEIQLKVSKIVQKSLDLREEGKKLLEQAKKMVEKEIEKETIS